MKPRVFTLGELLERSRRLTPEFAALFLDGPEGLVEKGIVARVPGGYAVTEQGWHFLAGYSALKEVA